MTAVDFFFISAGVGIWIFVIIWIYICYKIIRFITEAELKVKSVKDTIKLGGLTLLGKILGSVKGSENNDSKK